MSEIAHQFVHGSDFENLRQRWPINQHNLYSKLPGRRDFTIARRAAAVLRDDNIDVVLEQQSLLFSFLEGAAAGKIDSLRNLERRVHRIDAANHVAVLRCRLERQQVLSAKRQENATGAWSQHRDGITDTAGGPPSVANLRAPWCAPQRDQRDTRKLRCKRRIGGNLRSIGMCCIHQHDKILGTKIARQSFHPPETANPQGDGMLRGGSGAARQRELHSVSPVRTQQVRDPARLRRSAKYEDGVLHNVS
jgi:hypothetical protein